MHQSPVLAFPAHSADIPLCRTPHTPRHRYHTQMTTTPHPASPRQGFLSRRLEGWRLRHQLPFNFWIHMVGIPLALLVAPLLLVLLPWEQWYWWVGAFVVGYVLQWIG